MNEINEKLAELCGFVQFNKSKCPGCELSADRQRCAFDQGSDCPRLNMPDYIDAKGRMVFAWNPTADLNQLKMCYEALSEDWGEDNSVTFEYAFTEELTILIRGTKVKFGAAVTGIELATAWGKHPELVAQAILKAKEVS